MPAAICDHNVLVVQAKGEGMRDAVQGRHRASTTMSRPSREIRFSHTRTIEAVWATGRPS